MACLLIASLVVAVRVYPQTADKATASELADFDYKFLDSHYEVAQDLRRDPSLIGSRKYLKDHPGLHRYLVAHPLARQHIHDDPADFVARETWFRDTDGLPRPGRDLNDWERVRAQMPAAGAPTPSSR